MKEDPIGAIADLRELLKFGGSIATKQLASTRSLLTQKGMTHILELCEALWIHSGNPSDPHAETTSGQCSNGYVNLSKALCYTNVCDILAYHMVAKIDAKIWELDLQSSAFARLCIERYMKLGWVIGSDHAGATFSHDVAHWLGVKHDFTEKGGTNSKEQLWKRLDVGEDESVLQVEDLMTTGGTILAVREGIQKGNPNPVTFVPIIGVLVHRSDIYEIDGAQIVYLAHYDIKVWNQDECPLCKAGSKRIRPKQNWKELTGK